MGRSSQDFSGGVASRIRRLGGKIGVLLSDMTISKSAKIAFQGR